MTTPIETPAIEWCILQACETFDAPDTASKAKSELTALKQALSNANQLIGAQANENDAIVASLKQRVERLEGERDEFRKRMEFAEGVTTQLQAARDKWMKLAKNAESESPLEHRMKD